MSTLQDSVSFGEPPQSGSDRQKPLPGALNRRLLPENERHHESKSDNTSGIVGGGHRKVNGKGQFWPSPPSSILTPSVALVVRSLKQRRQPIPSGSAPPLTQDTATHDLGGTLRDREASSTLARIRPLLPRFGITRVANVTGLDRIGIPVWMCIRPNGHSLSVSQGKGITSELAQASAIMESIELFHSEHVRDPDLIGSFRETRRSHNVLDPGDLEPGISWRAYNHSRKIGWMRGTELVGDDSLLVPHVRLKLNYSDPHPEGGLLAISSTGLASGNHPSEALCHAVFEVIERDCEWRWGRMSVATRRATELDGKSVRSPMLQRLLDQFAAAETSVRMWDMTSKVGIPAFRCTLSETGPIARSGPFAGNGCHLSTEIALSRALTEAAQSRLTYIAGSRDDIYPATYQSINSLQHHPSVSRPTRHFEERPSVSLGATFEEDLQTSFRLLGSAGFRRVVAVDLTQPEFGLPVVMVLIPGMREED